ncbi:MAG: hypothetical protein AAGJ35_14770, partial [Myxococcota bacterium]
FGTFFLGQGNLASDGVSEKDLSGTQLAFSNGGNDGALFFRSSVNNALITNTKGAFFDGGAGRNNRVRYDTPTFAGFRAGISVDSRGDFDAGLHFNKKDLAGVDISAGFGYANFGRNNAKGVVDINGIAQRVSGSLGILHRGTGLNIYGAAGTFINQFTLFGGTTPNAGNNTFFEVQAGWKGNIFDFGGTALAVAYHRGNIRANTLVANTFTRQRPQFIAVKAVQKIDALSMELYARYVRYFTRINGQIVGVGFTTPTRAINVVAVGARVRF